MLDACSFELRDGVDVSLEGTVDNVGSHVDHVGHDGLVHASIPLHVSWLSVSVSIGGSVVLMVDWGLSGSPLSVGIGKRWVLGKDSGDGPVEQVWVVHQRLGVEGVVVHDNGSCSYETTTKTSGDEPHDPGV